MVMMLMWVPTDDDNDFDKDDVEGADSKDDDGDTNNDSDRTMRSSMCTQAVKDFQEFAYHSRDVDLITVCLVNFD